MSVNPNLVTEHYPLPVPEDLVANMVGCKTFTVLDLKSAYLQVPLDDESRRILTVNTPFGLYQFTRLPYGVSSAPAIFQAVMDNVLRGLGGVSCYLDDVLVGGRNREECLERVKQVLSRFEKHCLCVNEQKCQFFLPSITYLGHEIMREGLKPCTDKVEAVLKARRPTNPSELKSWVGLVNFYAKFLPDLSAVLFPLCNLLKKNTPWMWSPECEQSFATAKQLLCSADVLVLYDAHKPLRLSCDASSYGLGAVLSQETEPGIIKPVAYASRTMTPAEQKYSQFEKEGLALVFAVKKFHKYVYGRPFTLITDHHPLITLLGPKHHTTGIATARIHRWRLLLAEYSFTIKYQKGSSIADADALSRPPLRTMYRPDSVLNYVNQCEGKLLNLEEVQDETRKDKILQKVKRLIQKGWPKQITNDDMKPWWVRREALTIENNCIV